MALEQWRNDPAHQGKSKAPVQPAVSTPVTPPTYAPVTTPSPPRKTTLGPDNLAGKRGKGPQQDPYRTVPSTDPVSPVSGERDAMDSGAFEKPSTIKETIKGKGGMPDTSDTYPSRNPPITAGVVQTKTNKPVGGKGKTSRPKVGTIGSSEAGPA